MSSPKISVVMPFYNCEKYLDESVASILGQTYKDFEFIIINDASTDGSEKILQKYLIDERIIYFKNPERMGIVHNLNYGIEIAKGEFLARMDGDDISSLNRLQTQIDFLDANPEISFVGSNARIIDSESQQTGEIVKPEKFEDIKKDLFIYLPIHHPTITFRTESLQKLGGYRQQYLYTEDTDLVYRLVYSGYKCANINQFLLSYRVHPDSSVNNSRQTTKKNFQLRQETIKTFHLKITLRERVFMYIHLTLGLLLDGRQKVALERLYKRYFHKQKT